MTYTTRFSSLQLYEDPYEFSPYGNADLDGLETIRAQRLSLLNSYPTEDLREIYSIFIFLTKLVALIFQNEANGMSLHLWLIQACMISHPLVADHPNPNQVYDICIAGGPALILTAYEARDMDLMDVHCPLYDCWSDIPLFSGFFSDPLKQIWVLRNVPAPPETSAHLNSILETVPGGLDSCMALLCVWTAPHLSVLMLTPSTYRPTLRCLLNNEAVVDIHQYATTPTIQILSHTNTSSGVAWEHLDLHLPTRLTGKVFQNRLETDALNAILGEAGPTAIADLVGGIYREVDLQPEYADWKEEDSLCEDCVNKLVGAHIHLWLLGRKVKSGQ